MEQDSKRVTNCEEEIKDLKENKINNNNKNERDIKKI